MMMIIVILSLIKQFVCCCESCLLLHVFKTFVCSKGKAYGQMLLGFEINNVPDLEALAQAEDNLTQRQE